MKFEFPLKYQVADCSGDMSKVVEVLGESGCTDAVVGIGRPGTVELIFTREAESAKAAVSSALNDVKKALASGRLVKISHEVGAAISRGKTPAVSEALEARVR